MDMIMKGFGEVIKEHHIRIFSESELELLISGVGTINIKDWRDNTEYKNCKADDKVLENYKETILTFHFLFKS